VKSIWFEVPRVSAQPRHRLLCFTYAGAGPNVFSPWPALLGEAIEVHALQLPGHGARLGERPATSMTEILDALASYVGSIADVPFSFFGHSMGARIAFELARQLRDRGGCLPQRLFLSGAGAPDVKRPRPDRHSMSTPDLIAELRRIGGTPEEILRDSEMMAMVIGVLRADFRLLETTPWRSAPPLDLPFEVLGGRHDETVARQALDAWSTHTTSTSRVHMFDGGHFFVDSARAAVVEHVRSAL
jgi:medium-chain acyl-[acyl-carrier-protein] hydrolase